MLGANRAALVFVSGLVVLAFLAGNVVAELGVFPSGVVREAVEAARDWRRNWRHYLQIRSRFTEPAKRPGAGVTVHDPAAAFAGYTFVTAYRDGRFGALLLDMGGTVRHRWDVRFSEVWPEPAHLDGPLPGFEAAIHGAALLPGGEVVLNFEGAGTVKLDRCSRVLWSVSRQTHHAVEPLPDGGFLIPSRRRLTSTDRARLPGVRLPEGGWLWEDTLVRVDPQGRVVDEFSLLEALLASGLEGVLYANGKLSPTLGHTNDPLHLNDVELLPESMAAAFPLFAPGDIVVSLLSLNTIAVLDPATRRVKWSMTGPFLRQHDPDFLPNGHILVFDNRKGGAGREFGFSRLLEIDPTTRRVMWSYAGTDREPFYTDALGKQQPLPNGNILVTEAQRGRVFELARDPDGGGRIVWEWINNVEGGLVGWTTQAERVAAERVDFLGDMPCR